LQTPAVRQLISHRKIFHLSLNIFDAVAAPGVPAAGAAGCGWPARERSLSLSPSLSPSLSLSLPLSPPPATFSRGLKDALFVCLPSCATETVAVNGETLAVVLISLMSDSLSRLTDYHDLPPSPASSLRLSPSLSHSHSLSLCLSLSLYLPPSPSPSLPPSGSLSPERVERVERVLVTSLTRGALAQGVLAAPARELEDALSVCLRLRQLRSLAMMSVSLMSNRLTDSGIPHPSRAQLGCGTADTVAATSELN
jgi:hypothetical protein